MPLHDWTDRPGWEGVHHLWITELLRWIKPRLPAPYRAFIGSAPLLAIGGAPPPPGGGGCPRAFCGAPPPPSPSADRRLGRTWEFASGLWMLIRRRPNERERRRNKPRRSNPTKRL